MTQHNVFFFKIIFCFVDRTYLLYITHNYIEQFKNMNEKLHKLMRNVTSVILIKWNLCTIYE